MTNRSQDGQRASTAFLLAQVGARAAQAFAEAIAPLKLTPADAGILRLLACTPGVSQQNLARALDMHASRLVGVIDALEQRLLVVREPNPEDRRLYSLRLTEAGALTLREIGQAARAHNEAVTAPLTDEERTQLASLLQRIATEMGLQPGIHPGYRNLGQSPKL